MTKIEATSDALIRISHSTREKILAGLKAKGASGARI